MRELEIELGGQPRTMPVLVLWQDDTGNAAAAVPGWACPGMGEREFEIPAVVRGDNAPLPAGSTVRIRLAQMSGTMMVRSRPCTDLAAEPAAGGDLGGRPWCSCGGRGRMSAAVQRAARTRLLRPRHTQQSQPVLRCGRGRPAAGSLAAEAGCQTEVAGAFAAVLAAWATPANPAGVGRQGDQAAAAAGSAQAQR